MHFTRISLHLAGGASVPTMAVPPSDPTEWEVTSPTRQSLRISRLDECAAPHPHSFPTCRQVAVQSAELAAIPAGVMFLGSIMTILSPAPPPKIMAHALQHLAAGIMLAAIAMELVTFPPAMQDAQPPRAQRQD